MDLTDRQRKLVFAGIIVALAAVGIYLTLPNSASNRSSPAATETPSAAAPAPATSPPGISSTISPDGFDIYRLLPFSQRDFATAADLAQRFTVAYGTYRYDEDPAAYGQRLRPFVTDQLLTDLQRSAAAPGIIDQRDHDQVVAVGSAAIDSIRDITTNSVIFEVTGKQRLTAVAGTSEDSKRWAVTVARDGGVWRVYAFEPADAGQAGDTG
ncbi:MAG TPA: hypothetical protein VFU43_13225 [Streptosporangiaceae bacterium]|nr:hypothetical protein [Streptosporangiaceae bacterium]